MDLSKQTSIERLSTIPGNGCSIVCPVLKLAGDLLIRQALLSHKLIRNGCVRGNRSPGAGHFGETVAVTVAFLVWKPNIVGKSAQVVIVDPPNGNRPPCTFCL